MIKYLEEKYPDHEIYINFIIQDIYFIIQIFYIFARVYYF